MRREKIENRTKSFTIQVLPLNDHALAAFARQPTRQGHIFLNNAGKLMNKAKQAGLPVNNIHPEKITLSLLAPDLTPAKLKAWQATIKDEFQLLRARHIFCAFDRRPGMAYRQGNFSEEAKITEVLSSWVV